MKSLLTSLVMTCAFTVVMGASAPSTVEEAAPAGSPAVPDEATVRAALESAATLLSEGKPAAALEALRVVERAEPDNPWLWFYTGSAELQLGNPYRAIDAYDRALAALADLGEPDAALTERIRQHRYRARQQVFRISLQTGLAYDTDVTFLGGGGPALGLISGRADGRFGAQFQLDYSPLADEHQALTLGTRLSNTWQFSIEQFNVQDYGGYLRYARRLDRQWTAAVQYDYDIILLGNEPFLSSHMLTPSLSYRWETGAGPIRPDETRVSYRFQAGDFLFLTTPVFDQDALACGVGVEQSFKLRPVPNSSWTWDLAGGYRFDAVSTEGTEFDRDEHTFSLGLGVPLVNPAAPDKYLILPDKPLTFRFGAEWQIGDYRNPSLIDYRRRPRCDLLTTWTFELSQTLLQDAHTGDLVLHGLISWTDAESSATTRSPDFPNRRAKPFTYDKVVYGVQLEWSW